MPFLHFAVLAGSLLSAVLAQEPAPSPRRAPIKVRLNPSRIRDMGDSDYTTWTVPIANTASQTISGVNFTLAAGSSTSDLDGTYYKFQYTRWVSSLGERVVNEGVTTSEQAGLPITLTIKGLAPGNHTFLSWHNVWDNLPSIPPIDISVDGVKVVERLPQSIRVDNIWESANAYLHLNVASADQTIRITYKPNEGNTSRVYFNAFEINTPKLGDQISFPDPRHRDERIELAEGATTRTASWRAPTLTKDPKYNVYFGTSRDDLKTISIGQTATEAKFPALNTFETYYWRVDVTSGCNHYTGRVFMFRLAQLAFPGAEGYGRWARGGRGGRVVHVTRLDDDLEPGSLRHALTVEKGPRTVVFDVGGVITTTSRMAINDQYLTVAGQTAPGKGIVVQGWPVGLTGANDVIIRHFRVRPGKLSGQTVDGMGMQGSNFCIFDRCSISWGQDENFSSRAAHNITLQRALISEPLNVAGHKNYPPGTMHGYTATVSGDKGSMHHNLLAHAYGRSWSMGGNLDDAGFFAGYLDLRNNVVYNFGYRTTEGGAHEVNFVGNYHKQGPASWLTHGLQAQYENQLPGRQQYHCLGNSVVSPNGTVIVSEDSAQYPPGDGTHPNSTIACWADVTIDPPPPYKKFYDEPFFPPHVQTQSSYEAYKRVLSDSGAQQPFFDLHDRRIVNETRTGTHTYVGSASGLRGIIDDVADVGGLEDWPAVLRDNSRWDADGDGIADWWDGSTGGPGWTPLEGYLNWMAEPHAFVEPGDSVGIELAQLARGFVAPIVYSVTGAAAGTVSVSGEEATYTAPATTQGGRGVAERLTVSFKDAEGSEWERAFGVAVFQRASEAQ